MSEDLGRSIVQVYVIDSNRMGVIHLGIALDGDNMAEVAVVTHGRLRCRSTQTMSLPTYLGTYRNRLLGPGLNSLVRHEMYLVTLPSWGPGSAQRSVCF